MKARTSRAALCAVILALGIGVQVRAEDEIHVSTTDAMKSAVSKAQPEYPTMARQLKLEGSVEVEAHINADGTVGTIRAKTGNAVLVNAAITAVQRWRFTPFTEGGRPVKAVADLTFNFHM